uniref:Putative secreted protein n=1 Tax=Anopheles darlingi TaxID=43151 RepID=A0A2M4DL68_ANODA
MAQLFQHRLFRVRLMAVPVVVGCAVRASRCTTAALNWPGSLKYGSGTRMRLWIDTSTCRKLDVCAFHFSSGRPCHVFNTDRQTLPSLYRFGLKRTVFRPVVSRLIIIGELG